jgi:hypothetical protein
MHEGAAIAALSAISCLNVTESCIAGAHVFRKHTNTRLALVAV